jgi:hypothetical protein
MLNGAAPLGIPRVGKREEHAPRNESAADAYDVYKGQTLRRRKALGFMGNINKYWHSAPLELKQAY